MSEVLTHGTFANLNGSVQSKNIRDSRDELTISVSSSNSFRTSEALSKTGMNI
jgi:type IV secretory pathway TrbL component